jgi:quinoprotein glucose dehydrogenase
MIRAALLIALEIALAGPLVRAEDGYRSWSTYGGSPENIRYSKLQQINRANVQKLTVAWTFNTGDDFKGSEMQCNPIVANGVLYATTPKLRVIALDAATGNERWSFDPNPDPAVTTKQRNRGVTYWESGSDRRVFFVWRQYLHALDAATGKLIPGFGTGGRVDLREGLGRDPQTITISASSPGVIYKDLFIIGGLMGETLPSPPGDIRAFDARTGKLRWSFHTIPHPGEFGYDTWPKDGWKYLGSANNWAGMAVDEKRGLVFAPTGSAAFDFYGGNRRGEDLFANTLLALKADTGERVWHFQAVHHDVWDRDFPSPPSLVTIRRAGRAIDAVAQITKSGHVYVFERETGKPLFPIEEREVSTDGVEGEHLSPKQPLPQKPPAFARQLLTEEMLTKRTPEAHASAVERFRKLRSAGQFVPPSRQGTIIFPGYDGGGEWGGAAFDPDSGLLYVNSNEMAWVLRLVELQPLGDNPSGRSLYMKNCSTCHREDMKGTPPEFPSLVGTGKKYSNQEFVSFVRKGAGRMPGFPQLTVPAVRAIAQFVATGEDRKVAVTAKSEYPIEQKFVSDGYNKFLDAEGYPAIEPPWGTLNAIDLNKGEIAWKIPFGEYPELAAKGLRNTGTENYGGPLVTSGGLLFIGATNHDRKFHVFDKATGKLLWETLLPAAGNATPATYEIAGRQYVVIAAGGGKSGAPSGGTYVAFALP